MGNILRLFRIIRTYIDVKFLRSFSNRVRLERYQQRKLKKHLKWICQNSPFYSSFINCPLSDFPIISKVEMMENFNKLNTAGIDKDQAMNIAIKSEETRDFAPMIGDITVGLSSGTSGNRGMFLASNKESATWAGTILAKVLPKNILHKQRVGLFLRANSNLYTTVSSKRIQFNFFDLIKPVDDLAHELENFQPTILVSPPSMLRLLAKKIEVGELKINPIKVISAAEVLDPVDEKYIAKQFKLPVHQIYQCTEGFLATSCAQGTIHLNEDIVIIEKEWLDDEKTRFMPIITDMERTTQPIIRYRLNDILSVRKTPCPCGSPHLALDDIEGRMDDLFFFKSGQKTIEVFPDFMRRRIISASDDIIEYKIIQHDIENIEIQLQSIGDRKKIEDLIQNSFDEFFQQRKYISPSIRFSDFQTHTGIHKLKRVECRIK